MPRVEAPAPWLRRAAADVALWTAIGVVMALLGPFGTSERTLVERLTYWLICMVGGGMIGIAIDAPVRRVLPHFWARLAAVSVAMTPPVTVLVGFANHWVVGMRLGWGNLLQPWFQVFVVCVVVMLFRQLVWSRAPVVAAPPAPAGDPAGTFRQRLSAKRRAAGLIAVEAEDHYLRVHTDAGEELITARFGDALAELAAAPGFRTHRSWWVAADAIDEVRWRRGRGEAKLKCGLVVPISRSNAAPLKAAGWF
ncbi:LytTR family DNA-binding domain-containing protein [uncultured Phenylobacterium sp.]|uniref:LytTR family DNA-binding domain-containing protein n=1 Tax=uncultured Phenylobacterium sp. TaxID=349273 RepID=UPI0025EEDB9B|nr:LytTR family DNA-binding domain-containing protein [uncultured Phenylobacterium sp.]